MARKRMISPEMWENEGFGELSILAKVLFIGMISQADDDGKGVLSPQLLKSKILPYDELRIADVDKALNEIGHNLSAGLGSETDKDKALNERGHKLSVVFYEVGGKRYYLFENWRKWQTINRPIPSKLPNPPVADGEGGGMRSQQVFNDNSMSTHTQLNECSRPIEVYEDEMNNNTHTAREEDLKELPSSKSQDFQKQFDDFVNRWGISIDSNSPFIRDFDFGKLNAAYERSTKFLQADQLPKFLSWIVKNYSSIIKGKYNDREKKTEEPKYSTSYNPNAIPWEGDGGLHITRAGGDDDDSD